MFFLIKLWKITKNYKMNDKFLLFLLEIFKLHFKILFLFKFSFLFKAIFSEKTFKKATHIAKHIKYCIIKIINNSNHCPFMTITSLVPSFPCKFSKRGR